MPVFLAQNRAGKDKAGGYHRELYAFLKGKILRRGSAVTRTR